MKTLIRRVAFLAAVAVTAAVLPMPTSGAATHSVAVRDNFFDPGVIEIAVGDTVTWTWEGHEHSVTADDGSFDSDLRTTGATFDWTFETPGTFQYHCELHLDMKGTVQVGEVEPPPPVEAEQLFVPSGFPTIEEAVAVAPAGAEVVIDAGTYRLTRQVVIDKPLTITSGRPPATSESETDSTSDIGSTTETAPTGPGRSVGRKGGTTSTTSSTTTTTTVLEPEPEPLTAEDVVIAADGWVDHAFVIQAPGTTIRTMTVRDFIVAGIRVEGSATDGLDLGYVVQDVHLLNNVDYGLQAIGERQDH